MMQNRSRFNEWSSTEPRLCHGFLRRTRIKTYTHKNSKFRSALTQPALKHLLDNGLMPDRYQQPNVYASKRRIIEQPRIHPLHSSDQSSRSVQVNSNPTKNCARASSCRTSSVVGRSVTTLFVYIRRFNLHSAPTLHSHPFPPREGGRSRNRLVNEENSLFTVAAESAMNARSRVSTIHVSSGTVHAGDRTDACMAKN